MLSQIKLIPPSEAEFPRKTEFPILCESVKKRYVVFDQGQSWRVLFTSTRNAHTVEAVRGVSITVPKGEIVGVLGRNGSGKSTLLRLIGGVYTPTEGWVRVAGTVGSLFELGGLGNEFISGREYADRILSFQGIPRRDLARLLDEIKEFSELGDYFERYLHTYSTGMCARLYFAAAMALPREVFLIDEILSVGDAHFQAKSWRRVRDRLARGASGILVTHDWSAVIKLCQSALILADGKVIEQGPSDRIVASYLELPKPDGKIARFVDLQPVYEGTSASDLTIPLFIEAQSDLELEFAFSVELLRLGIGWEILLLSEFHSVGRGTGKRKIVLSIPRLPLAPGDYSLNIFLRTDSAQDAIELDSRTWTTGSGLRLAVRGTPSRSVTRVPISWRLDSVANA